MFSPAQLRAIFTLALVAVVVQGSWFEGAFTGGRQENVIARQYIRQDTGGGGILDSVLSGLASGIGGSSTDGTSSSTTTSSDPTSGSSSSSQTSSSSTSSQPTTSSSSSSSQSSSSSDTVTSTPTTSSSHSQTSSDTRITTSPGSTTVIVQTTVVDGKPTTMSSTSTSPGYTSTPGALQDGSSNKSTGMSSKTKTTIIGVVVGIGGFAIVVGLLVVAWKIWGRKKTEEEGDELMSNYGREKESSASGSTSNPFQSTLDQYHNPSRNVNPSANF